MRLERVPARTALVALALVCAICPASARGAEPIDPNWLAMADCPAEPGCPAIVLLDERELAFDDYRVRYKARVLKKLFTAEGVLGFSDAELPPTRRGGWLLHGLSGRTILPDGSEIPLKRGNIHEKVLKVGKKDVRVRTTAFAGVVPGSLVEYEFELNTSPGRIIPGEMWELQQRIPVLEGVFRVKKGRFDVSWARTGIDRPEFERSPEDGKYELRASAVPSIPDEPQGPTMEALRTRFYFFLQHLQATWLGSLAGRVAGRAGSFLEGGNAVSAKLKELVAPGDPPRARIEKIYRYVQEHVLTEEEAVAAASVTAAAEHAGDVLNRGSGSEYERTMLFLSLAKEAGLRVALLLIESRPQGVFNDLAPVEEQFDSFAAAVKIGDDWTFYDPGTWRCPFGMVSPEKEGEQFNGILVEPDKSAGKETFSIWGPVKYGTNEPAAFTRIRLPFRPAAKNVLLRRASGAMGTDGAAEVDVVEQGSGAVDLAHRTTYARIAPGERARILRERLDREIPDAAVTEETFEDLDSLDKPATIRYRIHTSEAISRAADRLILAPFLFGASRPNPFTAEKRRTPVFFPHAQTTQDRIEIQLPPGHAVDSLPAPAVLEDPPFMYKSSVSVESDRLVVLRLLVINAIAWPAADYSRLRTFFEKVQEADRQVVVFKRAPGL